MPLAIITRPAKQVLSTTKTPGVSAWTEEGSMEKKHIVVLGGGYAGVHAAKALHKAFKQIGRASCRERV